MTWIEERETIQPPAIVANCPIVEAVVDLRFESKRPSETIFGLIFGAIDGEYGEEVINLPITQIPTQIWKSDPDLTFQPHFRLKDENSILQVGPRVISFISQKEYAGWSDFYKKIEKCLTKAFDADVISKVTRIGVRYVNVIDDNNWDNTRIEIMADGEVLNTKSRNLRFLLDTGEFTSAIKIADHARLSQGEKKFEGLAVDVDTYKEGNWTDVGEVLNVVENAHLEEKKTFFSLLKESFINQLEPNYEHN